MQYARLACILDIIMWARASLAWACALVGPGVATPLVGIRVLVIEGEGISGLMDMFRQSKGFM